jgi:hypothetical protein
MAVKIVKAGTCLKVREIKSIMFASAQCTEGERRIRGLAMDSRPVDPIFVKAN